MIYYYPMYVRYTRNLFLRSLCVVYLFVFTSLYVQIPGLYGTNGILPARAHLDWNAKTVSEKLQKPTLLWLAPSIGLTVEYLMDILTLAGIVFSSLGFLSQKFCTTATFVTLWALYLSIYQVGQNFMQSQWDTLLLETGALAVLLAPLRSKGAKSSWPIDAVIFFLLRWLLFRLTFSTGASKLAKGCSGWWKLDALNTFFETQPLPNVLSWYAHHLPAWFLQATAVFTITIETFLPILYFVPVRSVQAVAFLLQVFFQLSIFMTGNHGIYNILTIVLSLSLVDDKFFSSSKGNSASKWASSLICSVVYGVFAYVLYSLFSFKFAPDNTIQIDIAFTPQNFDKALGRFLPIIIYTAAFTFLVTLMDAFLKSLNRISTLIGVLVFGALAVFVLGLSIVPFSGIHPAANSSDVLPYLRPWNAKTINWHFVNPYGVAEGPGLSPCYGGLCPAADKGFKDRTEIIIEGADSLEGPWLEYEFRFKPGNVNNTLPFVAPHQPRLDTKMAVAAVTSYHENKWLMSLVYRLLVGQPEVIQLLDFHRNPFPSKPPKYIRASKYSYQFTDWSQRDSLSWWTRTRTGEYLPVFSRDQTALLDTLTSMKILGSSSVEKVKVNPSVKLVLDAIRHYTARVDPSFLPMTLFIAGCVGIMVPGSKSKPSGKRN